MDNPVAASCTLTARISEFQIPPISDGLIIGKDSPIGYSAISRALQLLVADHFHTVPMEDDVVSHIIIRRNLLRRIPPAKLVDFVQTRIKPLMSSTEILHLNVTVEVKIEDSVQ